MFSVFEIGDRVTRLIFLDDGTWTREGDPCLARSPLKHGTVVNVRKDVMCCRSEINPIDYPGHTHEIVYDVIWDGDEPRFKSSFLPLGIEKEVMLREEV